MNPLLNRELLQDALESGNGNGVRVAMLDTGVDETHPELADSISASYEVSRSGGTLTCVETNGTDEVGHGTACAGIIKRIAPDVELYSIKVIGDKARGSSDELVYGLRWAIENGMHLVNASLGTLDRRNRDKIADLADEAYYRGVIIVAAANNRGHTAYPANLSSVLAVDSGAFDESLMFGYRLNTPIELEANGIYINAPSPGGGTKYYTGTSFACPHVTGIVARILSAYPGLQPFEVRAALWNLAQQ